MKIKVDYKAQAPLGYLIHEVARLMKRRFEDEASMQEVTLPQWRALAHISNQDGMTQKALARAVDTDPMTMSGILDRLEKRGLPIGQTFRIPDRRQGLDGRQSLPPRVQLQLCHLLDLVSQGLAQAQHAVHGGGLDLSNLLEVECCLKCIHLHLPVGNPVYAAKDRIRSLHASPLFCRRGRDSLIRPFPR